MESDHSERIKDIQKMKEERERETRKKQTFVIRCAAAVLAAGIIFLIVFGIKSCVTAVSQKRAEREQAAQAEMNSATPTPMPDPKDIPTEGNVNNKFYKNSAFVGNSFVDGMEMYELVDGADYFARIGLNVKDALTLSTSTGSVSVIDELNSETKYNKIFLMFGENELGWNDADTFKTCYKTLINKVREYQSGAQIYLLSITPITQKVSDLNENGETKENIAVFNEKILETAKETNVNFVDLYTPLADENGNLPAEAASDGIHFNEKYYKKCLVYMQNAFND